MFIVLARGPSWDACVPGPLEAAANFDSDIEASDTPPAPKKARRDRTEVIALPGMFRGSIIILE
jgi:hypothetical protein